VRDSRRGRLTSGTEPVFDPREILRSLTEHQVEFTVVGGLAVQVHGYMGSTRDLDVVPSTDMLNLSRLGEALADMGAELLGPGRSVRVTDPHLLKRAALVPLMTRHGRLDLLNLGLTQGTPGSYDKLRANALVVRLGDMEIAVAGLDDLIRMKRATGREQDIADIGALTRSDEDLEREAAEST
jgi:hypothetical protein